MLERVSAPRRWAAVARRGVLFLLVGLAGSAVAQGSERILHGTIERIRIVQLDDSRRAEGVPGGPMGIFDRQFETLLSARTADELLVRLDDGRELVFTHYGMQCFQPGQRVRIISDVTPGRRPETGAIRALVKVGA